jgi:hypothetical protein
MQMGVDWATIKSFAQARSISIQFVQTADTYYLFAIDGPAELCSQITISSPASSDQTDFETNFKPSGNKSQPIQVQPFSSKALPNGKKLFKRFTGTSFALTTGSNTLTWTQSTFPWTKFVGLEIIGASAGDTCDLFVLDTATGTYSGVPNYPLNQFAYNANLPTEFYRHVSEYDADLYQNLQIQIVYRSVDAKTIYINFDMNEVK